MRANRLDLGRRIDADSQGPDLLLLPVDQPQLLDAPDGVERAEDERGGGRPADGEREGLERRAVGEEGGERVGDMGRVVRREGVEAGAVRGGGGLCADVEVVDEGAVRGGDGGEEGLQRFVRRQVDGLFVWVLLYTNWKCGRSGNQRRLTLNRSGMQAAYDFLSAWPHAKTSCSASFSRMASFISPGSACHAKASVAVAGIVEEGFLRVD